MTEPTDEELAALRTEFGITSNGRGIREFTQVIGFARAVLAKLGTPQPVVREPLTPEQVKIIVLEAGYDCIDAPDPERAAFISGMRHAERAHGITQKGGQHGTER